MPEKETEHTHASYRCRGPNPSHRDGPDSAWPDKAHRVHQHQEPDEDIEIDGHREEGSFRRDRLARAEQTTDKDEAVAQPERQLDGCPRPPERSDAEHDQCDGRYVRRHRVQRTAGYQDREEHHIDGQQPPEKRRSSVDSASVRVSRRLRPSNDRLGDYSAHLFILSGGRPKAPVVPS